VYVYVNVYGAAAAAAAAAGLREGSYEPNRLNLKPRFCFVLVIPNGQLRIGLRFET
jgi:hypothetical protein